MILLRVLIGASMLILGRQLFWLFVAGIGMVYGIDFVAATFPDQPTWLVLLIAFAAGLLGAVVAIVWQWIAVGIVGFMAGSYVVLNILNAFSWTVGPFPWLIYFLGGAVGAALLIGVFDWALIVLSSLTGATLMVQPFVLDPLSSMVLFFGLFVAGVAIQASLWQSPHKVKRG